MRDNYTILMNCRKISNFLYELKKRVTCREASQRVKMNYVLGLENLYKPIANKIGRVLGLDKKHNQFY